MDSWKLRLLCAAGRSIGPRLGASDPDGPQEVPRSRFWCASCEVVVALAFFSVFMLANPTLDFEIGTWGFGLWLLGACGLTTIGWICHKQPKN